MPSVLDHVLVVLIALVFPLYVTFIGKPLTDRALASGKPGVRIRIYWETIALQWLVVVAMFLLWFGNDRTMAQLGLQTSPTWPHAVVIGVVILLSIGLPLYLRALTASEETRRKVMASLEKAGPFLPRTRADMQHLNAVAVTAGICEELVYRGFLIWYLTQFTGDSVGGLAAAVCIAALVFGAGHLYQGVAGAAQVCVFALLVGALYVISESLWVLMAFHAYFDIVIAYFAYRLSRAAPTP